MSLTTTPTANRFRARLRPAAALVTLGALLIGAGAHAERRYFSEYDYPLDQPDKAFYYVEVPLPENPDGPGYLYEAHYQDGDALYAEGVRSGPGKDGQWLGDFRYLYPDGQIKEKGHNDEQGRPDGELITYYENGQVEKYKPYRDGKMNGVEKMYDEEGNLLLERPVKDNRPDGMQINYYRENGGPDGGQIQEERRYRDGNYDNFYNRYDRDGNRIGHADITSPGVLMAWTRYRNGNYARREAHFFRDDQGRFRDGAPQWLSVMADHNRDGSPSSVSLRYPQENSQWRIGFNGDTVVSLEHWINRVQQGSAIAPLGNGGREQGQMRDGLRTGTWEAYDDGGRLVRVMHYEKGRLNGDWRERSGPDGQRWTHKHYRQDQEDGPWRTENAAGDVVESGRYRQGQPVGDWHTLEDDGRVRDAHYVDGKLDGDWTLHSADGDLLAERHYRRGQRVGEWTQYDDSGELLSRVPYHDGQRHGDVFQRRDDGVQVRARFDEDRLDGPYQETTAEGYPRLEGHYQDGKRQGRFVEYSEQGRVEEITPYRDNQPDGEGWIRDRQDQLVPARWEQGRLVAPSRSSGRPGVAR
ncbi:MAG: hypothetical protein MK005_08975 [Alcanivorax sp.]|nr:hypothetical protein [Alcanivorax sp.]